MIKTLITKINNTVIPNNPNIPSTQIGNFCFLIAGIELLLSCETFVKFVFFYPENCEYYKEIELRTKSINITDMCLLCQEYYNKKTDMHNLYTKMQTLVLTELGEESRGQEDINVIFLYFEKNILYFLIFTKFQYVTFNYGQNIKQVDIYDKKSQYSIYTVINNFTKLTCENTLKILINHDFIYGVVFLIGNHYEIYRFNNKKIIIMNTNYLLNFAWKTLTILCRSYNTDCDLNIFNVLHSDKGIV